MGGLKDMRELARAFAGIASDAGAAIMQVYGSDFAVRTKTDGSPVSDADERAEAVILEALARLLPGVPVRAEESDGAGGVKPGPETTFVLVDPLDGTKEFVSRNGEFTVNIALVEAGRPVAGCVYAPALDRMFWGGSGAVCGRLSPGQPLSALTEERPIATRSYPADGLTAVMSRSHADAATTDFISRLKIADARSSGSSLKFCLVASGEADVYPRFGPTMEWDTAAGHAVLLAAGGQVLAPDGSPFLYGKADARNGSFVAWGREVLARA